MKTKMIRALFFILFVFYSVIRPGAAENEVIRDSRTEVLVREHPQTEKPFVSIRAIGEQTRDPFRGFTQKQIRPDYRMLDPKVRSGEIPYEGPVSDKTKIYVFAATMITLGVAGVAVTAALPAAAAAGAGSSGGAGLLGAGAVTVVAGTAGTVAVASHLDPGEENYIHTAESRAIDQDVPVRSFSEVLAAIDSGEEDLLKR